MYYNYTMFSGCLTMSHDGKYAVLGKMLILFSNQLVYKIINYSHRLNKHKYQKTRKQEKCTMLLNMLL